MKYKISCIALSVTFLAAGCSRINETSAVTESSVARTEISMTQTEELPSAFEYNPHVYSEIIAQEIPQDYWDSFYNLCDALRAGEDTFACSSSEAYEWCMDPVTLNNLFPAACMMVTGVSSDGSAPFEEGLGRIYYNIPKEEYVTRQSEFEELVMSTINSVIETDDSEFEKALKLYDYIATNYTYVSGFPGTDGVNYYTLTTGEGECVSICSSYNYMLLQLGVDAIEVGCYTPEIAHSWSYVMIGGQGYYIDPTWALKGAPDEALNLDYFMMTDSDRNNDGCLVEDLTASMVPEYWINNSSVTITATDNSYHLEYCYLISLDEESKTLYYEDPAGDFLSFEYE